MAQKIFKFKFEEGAMPASVNPAKLTKIISAVQYIAYSLGIQDGIGHEFRDKHIRIWLGSDITVALFQQDEAGNLTTEVLNAYREEDGQYEVFTLRPGRWMDYLLRLERELEAADLADEERAEKAFRYAFEPVADQYLKDAKPELPPRVTRIERDGVAWLGELRKEQRTIHLKLNRLMREIGIEDYWNVE